MSRIINKKTPKHFYIGDRQLLRDTRLSSDAKNIYQVLSSLAESCENVCPSYTWLANEVGYITEGKEYRSIHRWVSSKIDELTELKMVVSILRPGTSCDFEVYDYTPDKKVQATPDKKVQATPDKKVQATPDKKVHLEERDEKKEFNTLSKNKENFDLQEKINEIKGNPLIATLLGPIDELNIPEKAKEKLTERAFELCAVEMENKKAHNNQIFGYMRNCIQQAINEFNTTKKTNTTIQKADYYEGKKNNSSPPKNQSSWIEPTPQTGTFEENGGKYRINRHGTKVEIFD
jgi:hypothetical protein